MKTYNVAIIGQGRSGRDIHGAFFRSDFNKGRFRVVAVVDELEYRRETAAQEYGREVSVYSDYRALTGRGDIDLIVNSTYSKDHFPITLDLLKNGYNVISEKPAAMHADDVRAMIAAAKENNVFYDVFQQSRFTPYFQQVKKVIASGALGRIVEIDIAFDGFSRRWDWQTLQENGGGSLYNTGPHPLDQALDLLDIRDAMPGNGLNVFCKMDRVNTYGDAEDYVKLILTAPGKPLIDLMISSCNPYPCFTYRIQGENGGLKGDMQDIEWKYYDLNEAPDQKLIRESLRNDKGYPMYCSEKLTWHTEKWHNDGSGAFDNAVNSYYSMIYDHFTEGRELTVKPEQVIQQIAVIEEAHRQNPLSRLGE